MRRLLLALVLFPCSVSVAQAWSWPVRGQVLQTFSFDPAHPYAAGERRGIEIAATDGGAVVAPAPGVVSFAGSVPGSGRALTIATADGYSVTLTQLRSIGVAEGARVTEGAAVATAAASVHLGIRVTSNPQGYLDPLSFLPPLHADPGPSVQVTPQPDPAPAPPIVTTTQPEPQSAPASTVAASDVHAAAPPAPAPAPAAEPSAPGIVVVAGATRSPGIVIGARRPVTRSAPVPVARSAPAPTRDRRMRPPAPTATARPASAAAASGFIRRELPRDAIATPARYRAPRVSLALAALAALVVLSTAAILAMLVRMISSPVRTIAEEGARPVAVPEEDPRRARMAVRQRPAPPGPCRRARRAVRHLRALPPAPRQRRADGQRHRRARHAGDGLRRSRGRVAA